MKVFSFVVAVLTALPAYSSTYRYTSQPLSISYQNAGPALAYTLVGSPTESFFTIDVLDELQWGTTNEDVAVRAQFGQFSFLSPSGGGTAGRPSGDITLDDHGNIVDWQIYLERIFSGGADSTYLQSSPTIDDFLYRYEYERDCSPFTCLGTGSERITARSFETGTWEQLSPTEVPLPAGFVLFLSGIAALGLLRRTKSVA